MSTLKASFMRCRHCDASIPTAAADTPSVCPTCGRALAALPGDSSAPATPAPRRHLSDDDVLAFLGVMPAVAKAS
jgi:hypothetical protein